MPEYRTVNADLAAALVTAGVKLLSVDTKDGVTCEFVFTPVNTKGEAAEVIAARWVNGTLMQDAMRLSRNIKKVYFRLRETRRDYARAHGVSQRTYSERLEDS